MRWSERCVQASRENNKKKKTWATSPARYPDRQTDTQDIKANLCRNAFSCFIHLYEYPSSPLLPNCRTEQNRADRDLETELSDLVRPVVSRFLLFDCHLVTAEPLSSCSCRACGIRGTRTRSRHGSPVPRRSHIPSYIPTRSRGSCSSCCKSSTCRRKCSSRSHTRSSRRRRAPR